MENLDIFELEKKVAKIQEANTLIDFVNVALVEGNPGRFDERDIDNALTGISNLIGGATQEIMVMLFGNAQNIQEDKK